MTIEVAHRGIIFDYSSIKENTIKSIKSAICLGFDIIEIDICSTKNEFILRHDNLIKNNGKIINIEEYDKPYHTTLLEVLQTYNNIKFFFDIKNININIDKLIELTMNNINLNNVYFTSFNENHLRQICNYEKKHNIKIQKGFITSNLNEDIYDNIINKFNIDLLIIDYRQTSPELIDKIKKQNIKIAVWVVNDTQLKKYFKNLYVDYIITECIS